MTFAYVAVTHQNTTKTPKSVFVSKVNKRYRRQPISTWKCLTMFACIFIGNGLFPAFCGYFCLFVMILMIIQIENMLVKIADDQIW